MRAMRRAWLGFIGAVVLGSLATVGGGAGCGGKVTFVTGSGSGGDGSTGSTMGTMSTTSTSSTPTQSTSTGSNPSACQVFCAKTGSCVFDNDCVQQCLDLFVPGCEVEAAKLVACVENNVDKNTCNFTGQCDFEGQDYTQCTEGNQACGTTQCSLDEDSCSCAGECAGQNVHEICSLSASGAADCNCFIGATPVGSCKEEVSTTCSLEKGCCAGFWLGVDGSAGSGP